MTQLDAILTEQSVDSENYHLHSKRNTWRSQPHTAFILYIDDEKVNTEQEDMMLVQHHTLLYNMARF